MQFFDLIDMILAMILKRIKYKSCGILGLRKNSCKSKQEEIYISKPLNWALKALILALKASAEAFVLLLSK